MSPIWPRFGKAKIDPSAYPERLRKAWISRHVSRFRYLGPSQSDACVLQLPFFNASKNKVARKQVHIFIDFQAVYAWAELAIMTILRLEFERITHMEDHRRSKKRRVGMVEPIFVLAGEEYLFAAQFGDEVSDAVVYPGSVTACGSVCLDHDPGEGFDRCCGSRCSILNPCIDRDGVDTEAQPMGRLLRGSVDGDAYAESGTVGLIAGGQCQIDRLLRMRERDAMTWCRVVASVEDQANVVEAIIDEVAYVLGDIGGSDRCADRYIGALASTTRQFDSIADPLSLDEIRWQSGFPIHAPGSASFSVGQRGKELEFDVSSILHGLRLQWFIDKDRDDFMECTGRFEAIAAEAKFLLRHSERLDDGSTDSKVNTKP